MSSTSDDPSTAAPASTTIITAASCKKANIVVIGAGWWSQGWHLPHLARNPNVTIVAIVDPTPHPKSNLNPKLESLQSLSTRYGCPTYDSLDRLFESLGPKRDDIDGAIVCVPHAAHASVGGVLLREGIARCRRRRSGSSVGAAGFKKENLGMMNVLMEKPMTTDVPGARSLVDLVCKYREAAAGMDAGGSGEGRGGGGGGKCGCFLVNHSANYRLQAKEARVIVSDEGRIGSVRHVFASFASPLGWIFDDPANVGWNEPQGEHMLGNGFAWGQMSHILAWIYHVCGGGGGEKKKSVETKTARKKSRLVPQSVYCAMGHSAKTGADVCHSASIRCRDGATISLSGTSLLPGNAHSDPPVAKEIKVEIYGTDGALFYTGNDRDSASGRLELRLGKGAVKDESEAGKTEVHCPELGFAFENLDTNGLGPESLLSFLDACLGKEDYYVGADAELGLMTVQTIDAMYRSHKSGMAEEIV